MILVAGALTLPFINDHTADAKKKKKYKGKSQKVSFENEAGDGGNGGNAAQVLEVRAEAAPQVPGGNSVAGNGGITGSTGSANGGNGGAGGMAAMLTHLLKVAMAVPVAVQLAAWQQVEASMRAQLVAMAVVPTTAARTAALVEACYWRISDHHRW